MLRMICGFLFSRIGFKEAGCSIPRQIMRAKNRHMAGFTHFDIVTMFFAFTLL
jgi:hypothetical protein